MTLIKYLYAQFARPHGLVGVLVGLRLARSNRERAKWTLSLLDLRPGDALMDVGCGPGVALELAMASAPLSLAAGLDHSPTMLAQARRRMASGIQAGRVELICGTPEAVGPAPRFDKICSMNVIQFLPDQAGALAILKSALRPGGRLATTYQPRGRSPTRAEAVAMADKLGRIYEQLGLVDVRVETLELQPAPAVCVVGDLPGEAAPVQQPRSATERGC